MSSILNRPVSGKETMAAGSSTVDTSSSAQKQPGWEQEGELWSMIHVYGAMNFIHNWAIFAGNRWRRLKQWDCVRNWHYGHLYQMACCWVVLWAWPCVVVKLVTAICYCAFQVSCPVDRGTGCKYLQGWGVLVCSAEPSTAVHCTVSLYTSANTVWSQTWLNSDCGYPYLCKSVDNWSEKHSTLLYQEYSSTTPTLFPT